MGKIKLPAGAVLLEQDTPDISQGIKLPSGAVLIDDNNQPKPLPSINEQMGGFAVQPNGTYQQERPKDLVTQMKEQAKMEGGLPTIHDNRVAKSNKPDIKEAIDNAVADHRKSYNVEGNVNMDLVRDQITKQVKAGELVPDFNSEGVPVLKKATGIFDSFVNAVNKAAIDKADNNNLLGLDTQGKIKYLEAKRVLDAQNDNIKATGLGKVGEFAGENADVLAKTAVGAMTGGALAPELIGAGHFGGFISTAHDFATGGGSNVLQRTYYDLKAQGLSDHDAMTQAEKTVPVGAATGLATGAILSGVPKLKADEGVVDDFITHLLKSSKKLGAVSGAEAGINDVAEMGVGVHKTAHDLIKDVGENTARGAATAVAFETLLNIHKVPAAIYNQARKVVASIPEGIRDEFINNSVISGELPKEKADEIKAAIIRPEEMNKPEAATIAPQENIPTEQSKGAAVILPETRQEPNVVELNKEVVNSGKSIANEQDNPVIAETNKSTMNFPTIAPFSEKSQSYFEPHELMPNDGETFEDAKKRAEKFYGMKSPYPDDLIKEAAKVHSFPGASVEGINRYIYERMPKETKPPINETAPTQESNTQTEENQQPPLATDIRGNSSETKAGEKVIAGFTEAADLNKMYAAAKAKYGDKKGAAIYEVANRLVNPNENTIVDIKSNGVTVKEGDKYTFKPFGNTDANSKKWTLYKGIDVTDQYVKNEPSNTPTTASIDKAVPNEKIEPKKQESKGAVPTNADKVEQGNAKPPDAVVSGKYEAKAKKVADKIMNADLPSWLVNKDPTIKKQGLSADDLKKVLADAVVHVGKLMDGTIELADAIKQGADKIIDHYKNEFKATRLKPEFEQQIRDGFDKYYRDNIGDGNVGVTHAALDKLAEELGLPDRYEQKPETVEQWDIEAKKRIADGKMPELIDRLKNNPDDLDHVDQRMILHYVAGLTAEYDATHSDAVLNKYSEIKKLNDAVGQEWGKVGKARQGVMPPTPIEGGLLSAMQAKKEANGVKTLTETQKNQVEGLVDNYNKADEFEAAVKQEVDKRYSEFLAQKEVDAAKAETKRSPNKNKTKEDYVKERKDIISSIKDKWKKAGDDNTLTAVPVPYAKQLMAIAPDVAKLVKSIVDEARDIALPELIKKVHEIIKEGVPEITERDVRGLIAGDYNEKKETRNELQAKVYDLRREAELLNKLEKLQAGDVSKSEKKSVAVNQRTAELTKKINEIRKRLGLNELSDEQKIKNVIANNLKLAEKYKQRVIDKDFVPEKKVPFTENIEFQKKEPQLYKQALEAIQKKNDAKTAFDIALTQDKIAKEDKIARTYRWLGKAKNTFQALVAGVDDSMMFVQLGYTLLNNPTVAVNFRKIIDENGRTRFVLGGAIKEHILDAWSEERFNRQMTALHQSSFWPLVKASGLDVLEPQSLLDKQKEEMFQHNLAHYIGIGTIPMGEKASLGDSQLKRVNLGKFLAIWERAYTSLGNNTRIHLFLREAKSTYDSGLTIENNPEEFKGLASAINNLTGRGSMHPKMAQIVPFVTPVIWSPKMIASSINLLGISDIVTGGKAGFYTKLPPRARAYAARQLAEGFAVAGALMLAAAVSGHTVHYNPHDPRWGDIEYGEGGNKSFNVFGRYASMMRLVVQVLPSFLGGGRMNKDGKVVGIDEAGGKTRAQVLGSYIRGKMNPVSGLGYDYVMNDKKGYYDNKPLTLSNASKEITIPMSLRDVRKEMERDGTISILNYDLPNFTGIPMKDQRDYFANQTGDKEIDDFLESNKLKIPATTSITNKDAKHPDGKISDDEFDEIVKNKEEKLNQALTKAIKHGLINSDKKPEQNQEEVKWMSEQSLEWAKDKVLGKKKESIKEQIGKARENSKRSIFKIGLFN